MARASHALSTIAEAKGDSDKKQQYINQGKIANFYLYAGRLQTRGAAT